LGKPAAPPGGGVAFLDKPMIYVFSALLLAVIVALAAALIADSVVADRALKKRERNEGNRR
jgi:hypothetical protein